MKGNICAILNIAPLYRKAIFKLMDAELECDFYFGDFSIDGVAMMDPSVLTNFKGKLNNKYVGNQKLVWQKGALKAAFGKGLYKNYILTGNPGMRSNWIILLLARIMGSKTYLWTHGLRGNEKGINKLKHLLYMHLATDLFLYSQRGAKLVTSAGINPRKVHVIYNSLDYSAQKEIRNKIGDRMFLRNYFGNDNPYILFVGRLTESKKIDIILNCVMGTNCNVVIVGDGPVRSKLESMLENPELKDRVWMYGECYDEHMLAQLMYHSSALISPGNIGLSAIHALTYGTVPVTNNDLNSQMPEVEAVLELESSIGKKLLFDINNPASITDVINDVVSIDKEKVRDKCYEIVEKRWNSNCQIEIMKKIFGI